jgi:hypothetical protein
MAAGPPMADYEPIIARAVAKLGNKTRANRAVVYERARAAFIAELNKRRG